MDETWTSPAINIDFENATASTMIESVLSYMDHVLDILSQRPCVPMTLDRKKRFRLQCQAQQHRIWERKLPPIKCLLRKIRCVRLVI